MNASKGTEGQGWRLDEALARLVADEARLPLLHDALRAYGHQYRNVLNSLKISLYLARKGGVAEPQVWDDLQARYHLVEQIIDRLQRLTRPMSLTPVTLPLDLLIEDRRPVWAGSIASTGRRLRVEPPPESLTASFDPMRLGQVLDDLVVWRALAGPHDSDLRVRWRGEGDTIVADWDEPPRDPTEGSSPGPEAAGGPSAPGALEAYAALTLPLLTRVVSLHGGTVRENDRGRWALTVRWPRDARPLPSRGSDEAEGHRPRPVAPRSAEVPASPGRRPRTQP